MRWPIEFRRVGAGKDGGSDVRAFQRLVLNAKIAMLPSLALVTAISKSTVRRDANGNPGLDKSTSRGRIDLLSAMRSSPWGSLRRRSTGRHGGGCAPHDVD